MIDIKAVPFNLDDEGVKWVEETKKAMTLEEKIGQLMVPIGYSADLGYLQHVMLDHHIGGICTAVGKVKKCRLVTDGFRSTAKSRFLLLQTWKLAVTESL